MFNNKNNKNKKPTPTKKPTAIKTPPVTQTPHKFAITSYGLKAVIGNCDYGLLGSVAMKMVHTKEQPKYQVPTPDGSSTSPATVAPIPAYDDLEFMERIILSLSSVLLQATENLTAAIKTDKKFLFLIVTPASVFERSKAMDTELLNEILTDECSAFEQATFRLLPADDNVTKNLQKALAAMDEGKFDILIFAGCDSLVNDITCNALLDNRQLKSNKLPDGIIPGEAAACVIIQKIDTSCTPDLATLALATITCLAVADEPNSGHAHETKLDGLSTAILSATQQAGLTPEDLDCIIRNSTTEQHYEFEWYQTSQRLWPNKLPEPERVAFQQGELDEPPELEPIDLPEQLKTSYALGEVGAASIPLNLVLACGRFDFNLMDNSINTCLVCEANEFLFRGVILLDNPRHSTSQRNNKAANRPREARY